MRGWTPETGARSWLRCYRCWSQDLEVQLNYEELDYPDVWTKIHAAGVEWDQFRSESLAAGAEQAFSIINRT